ncbi:unnamed protein product [Paramecium octaurelia]|uniref:MORN repeat protein n=1 Tax=Paramecium octaurelia TaxID=43137 RepID=A0A8S1YML5_PAROT|nr:unnamed protein product [Paramecium octaurelia]
MNNIIQNLVNGQLEGIVRLQKMLKRILQYQILLFLSGDGLYAEGGQLNEEGLNKVMVIYDGEYKNCVKIGRWNISYKDRKSKQTQQIGGGWYDGEDQNKLENGLNQAMAYMIYLKLFIMANTRMVKMLADGTFYLEDVFCCKRKRYSGGGLYDEGGSFKIGIWIESSGGFQTWSQVTFDGEYKNGVKVGKWGTFYKDVSSKTNELIGEGSYDEGRSLKVGKWIEFSDGFAWNQQFTHQGVYRDNKKQEDGILIQNSEETNKCYGIQTGKSIELSLGFRDDSQITFKGEYKNGTKVGRQDIFFLKNQMQWIYDWKMDRISSGFVSWSKITEKSEYKNGKKKQTAILLLEIEIPKRIN